MSAIVKRYQVLRDVLGVDGHNYAEDVLGGPVSEKNAYIAAYPRVLDDEPRIADLRVFESTMVEYSLSGSTGRYRIKRIEDGETSES